MEEHIAEIKEKLTETSKIIIVCGGRNFKNKNRLFKELDLIKKELGGVFIIHGGAKGADSLAEEWCLLNNVPFERFEADWSVGKHAGILRNRLMLNIFLSFSKENRGYIVAFPGGRGTNNMVSITINAGEKVVMPYGFC